MRPIKCKTQDKDIHAGLIEYPVFVKPVGGSASINISKVTTKEEIELLFSRYDNLMIQEFMDGIEYGADTYIDMISSEPVAIFTKEKIKMRAGVVSCKRLIHHVLVNNTFVAYFYIRRYAQ